MSRTNKPSKNPQKKSRPAGWSTSDADEIQRRSTAARQGPASAVLSSSILAAIILAAAFSGLMVRVILPGPFIALIYLLIVFAMAFELSVDLIRSKQLASELR